jgi:hypothetical protein
VIPELTRHGVLPPGIYTSTFDEIRDRYVTNAHRQERWRGFLEYQKVIQPITPILRYLFIGGSFITDAGEPKDIDIILEPPNRATKLCLDSNAQKLLRLAMSDVMMKIYGVQVWARSADGRVGPDFLIHLQRVKPEEAQARCMSLDDRKGILQVHVGHDE